MNITYKRKLPRSMENKAAVITIPRAIAQAWKQYDSVELAFDGNCLVIKPADGNKIEDIENLR